MHILLTLSEDAGDVYPMIAIARNCLRRGIASTLITNAYFEDISRRAGLNSSRSPARGLFQAD